VESAAAAQRDLLVKKRSRLQRGQLEGLLRRVPALAPALLPALLGHVAAARNEYVRLEALALLAAALKVRARWGEGARLWGKEEGGRSLVGKEGGSRAWERSQRVLDTFVCVPAFRGTCARVMLALALRRAGRGAAGGWGARQVVGSSRGVSLMRSAAAALPLMLI
jgi:hypothetical protein